MIFKNDYLFTPWEKDFLTDVANVKKSLDIICPFIKLPIIKKILVALPDNIRINLRLLTRFNIQVLSQKSSDLAVFDLLLNHAAKKYNVSIYQLNNLHAKIYIFDSERMYITSSNLSYSGLNSNFEIAVNINDSSEVIDIKEKTSHLFIPEFQIFNEDVNKLSEEFNKSNRSIIENALIKYIKLSEDVVEETYENIINDSGHKKK